MLNTTKISAIIAGMLSLAGMITGLVTLTPHNIIMSLMMAVLSLTCYKTYREESINR